MDDVRMESENNSTYFAPKPVMVLLTMMLLIGLCAILGNGLLVLAASLRGMGLHEAISIDENSSEGSRYFVRAALFVNHMASFLVPAILTLWFFYKKKGWKAASLNKLPDLSILLIGLLFVMSAFPLAQVAFVANKWLVGQFPVLQSWVHTEKLTVKLMEGLLVMQSPWEMVASLVVMAIVPALGEELVFRGIGQQKLIEITGKPALGIALTALIFSITHFEIQRFFAILLLGLVLGLLFFWTKNLWIPIAAHFLNNGAQVIIAWLNQEKVSQLKDGAGDDLPMTVILASAAVFVTSGFFLWKERNSE
ncbi:MAG: CPBP family intramembrane metalloprotease [Saprospiraceae bacterium]|nr:CPBP family intramembrane metalloprotease [Saprospiraceae bacterium]MCF8251586.1 CPBP family intramembrane metalloprotease [Saprospiraceae bacterium]MCF8282048.1 CPBP family intramembrane metalloprotease [Bacteroidales bacterium]MCF8313481.1 CPBP family intramembrane metalloprotease [Saprospiraceae bacterium]MCF8442222.1 CPBP family intramembrane metalloprotease [Saprospiraceae bacterium]